LIGFQKREDEKRLEIEKGNAAFLDGGIQITRSKI